MSPLSIAVAFACLEFTQTIFERFEPRPGSLEYCSLDVEFFPGYQIQLAQCAAAPSDRMLDELEARSGVGAREWVQALVMPAAAKLADRDGGRDYLRIMAELMNRPDPRFDRRSLEDTRSSVNRWRKLVAPLMPELSVNRLHRRFTALRIMHFELGRRAESSRRRDDRLFASHLVDLITAVLISPGSEETSGLLRERSQKN